MSDDPTDEWKPAPVAGAGRLFAAAALLGAAYLALVLITSPGTVSHLKKDGHTHDHHPQANDTEHDDAPSQDH